MCQGEVEMIANPAYVERVQALPDPSPAMQAYIARMLENDGTPARVDAAQDAYQKLSLSEREVLRDISRASATPS
jgi:hypothetical protein